MSKLKQLLTGIFLTIFVISLSVVVTLNFRTLYYHDMQTYHLAERYGYSEAEIRKNYDALIDYNSVFNHGELNFPTLPMSEHARIHFVEVKRIFTAIAAILLPLGLIGSIAGIFLNRGQRPWYLLISTVFSLGLPALIGIAMAIDWWGVFVTFHRIAFNNDYWLFDPTTDPIIDLLPDEFFMHCLMLILSMIAAWSILSLAVFIRSKKKYTA